MKFSNKQKALILINKMNKNKKELSLLGNAIYVLGWKTLTFAAGPSSKAGT